MHLTGVLMTLAVAATAILGNPIRRSAADIIADIQAVSDSLGDVGASLSRFSGTLPQSNDVFGAIGGSSSPIRQLHQDVNASPPLTGADSQDVVNVLTAQNVGWTDVIDKFVYKVDLFAKLRQKAAIASALRIYKGNTDDLSALLAAKLDPPSSTLAAATLKDISEKLYAAINRYS
ncbi:hypothetical protein BFJ72_g11318 [Fusarium proliferatum]|uniref:Hydrophobic surface binding protein A n=1 Tax=Gibberella intermedia TaxID=948311 RepID=A0A420SNA6_GIBIN|nr:hypothetical protein BFJ72_g11318 [Fusarium proliferatum]